MRNELNLFTKERIISLVFDNIDLAYDRFGRQIHEIHKALCASPSNVQVEYSWNTSFVKRRNVFPSKADNHFKDVA